MADLVMPRLSDTMEEGTILRWLKADGEQVARGEELVEIETDKATMTYESDQAGTLEIVAGVGANLSALIAEQAFDHLDAPVQRVTGADVPMPYSKPLEDLAYPHEPQVVAGVLATLNRSPAASGAA